MKTTKKEIENLKAEFGPIVRRVVDDLAEAEQQIASLEQRLKDAERELRQERGLKALLANGMPDTGNAAFNEVLATHPVAAMIQRGWLPGITGFDDLPALESAICHFWKVRTIEECVNPSIAALSPNTTPEESTHEG